MLAVCGRKRLLPANIGIYRTTKIEKPPKKHKAAPRILYAPSPNASDAFLAFGFFRFFQFFRFREYLPPFFYLRGPPFTPIFFNSLCIVCIQRNDTAKETNPFIATGQIESASFCNCRYL